MDIMLIQAPISVDLPIGKDISQTPEFEYLDTELMKVGSLAHESIDWDFIEQNSWMILTEKSKDYRVLSFLIQSFLQRNDAQYLDKTIELLKFFLENHWQGYPYNEETTRTDRQRIRFLSQIFKRVSQKIEDDLGTIISEISSELKEKIMANMLFMQTSLQKKQLVLEDLEYLVASFQKLEIIHRSNSEQSARAHAHSPQKPSQSEEEVSRLPLLQFLTLEKDPKFIDRLLIQLALNQEFLLATTIRRIVLWDGIKEIPIHDENGETTLSAPSQEVISRSNLLLTKDALHADEWYQLERSLMRAPFWLDAHRISALVAKRIFSVAYEIEIKHRLQGFLEKLPQLKTLKFSNGLPYLSEETEAWLNETSVTEMDSSAQKNLQLIEPDVEPATSSETIFYEIKPWNNYLTQAIDLYAKEGLGGALHILHAKIQQSENIREKVLWQLSVSQIYRQEGLYELSMHHDQMIMTQIGDIHLKDWEPQIFECLKSSGILS